MQNNMSLDDMLNTMGESYKNSFDMTSGKLVHVGDEETTNTGKVAQIVENTTKKVTPIQTGHVDMSNMSTVDINDILPKREKPNNDGMTDNQLAELDAAVDRECESITKRHNELFRAQQEEIDRMESEAEEDEMKKIDEFALTGVTTQSNTSGYGVTEPYYNYADAAESAFAVSDNAIKKETINLFDSENNEAESTNNATNADEEIVMEDPMIDNIRKPVSVNIINGVNNEDLFDDEDESTNDTNTQTDQEILDDLKSQIKSKISPIKKTLDLSKFTINQKAVSAQKVMKLAVTNNQNVADWVLPNAGRMISMTGLSGPEILKLNPENTNRNRMNTFRDMYRIMYDHIYDANKPEFEVWLKQLRFVDLQHVYFALYMATFNGSNFVNYSCSNPECKKVFISDVDFKDMVIYANDEVKEKVRKLMTGDSTTKSTDSYESTLVPISDQYAFAIRTPSVWNVIMETATLSDKFLEQYADLIDLITYIDAAYLIDENTQSLIPIDTKPDPNDMAKTAARRIATMYNIISKLSSEEYYNLRSVINDFDKGANDITYRIPKCTCPKCGKEIMEVESNPSEMLFTRHQLAAIGSM